MFKTEAGLTDRQWTYQTPGVYLGWGVTYLGSRLGEWDTFWCSFTRLGTKWKSGANSRFRSPFLPGRPSSPSDGAAASRWTQTGACPPCRRDACCVRRSSSPSASPEGERVKEKKKWVRGGRRGRAGGELITSILLDWERETKISIWMCVLEN